MEVNIFLDLTAFPVNLFILSYVKESRAGCGLKNRLREFLKIFAYVILMLFRVYLFEKIIPHCDCRETGAISKYVSNIVFFVGNIKGKTLLFVQNFDLKKTNS